LPNQDKQPEELLAAGEVKAALLLKGFYTPQEREIAQRAWEAGLRAGAAGGVLPSEHTQGDE
jgi:hypothetical protein